MAKEVEATVEGVPSTVWDTKLSAEASEQERGQTSIEKALILLLALSESSGTSRLTDLASAAALPKSTAHRLLGALESRGLVKRSRQEYALGDALFELGNKLGFCRPAGLREMALPFLGDLFAGTGQTVTLSVLSGADVLFLEKLAGSSSGHSPAVVGGRLPAHCTAPGKALLAHADVKYVRQLVAPGLRPRTGRTVVFPRMLLSMLTQVRASGIALDDEETSIGRACIAAPILHQGQAVAAVSVSAMTTTQPERFIPQLRRAISGIETALRGNECSRVVWLAN